MYAKEFQCAAAFSFHLVGKSHGIMGVIFLSQRCGHPAAFFNSNLGFCFHHRGRLCIRYTIDHPSDVNMIVIFIVFPGPGGNAVGGPHTGLARIQDCGFFHFDFGVRRYIVVRLCPVHTDNAAGACPGRAFGCGILNGFHAGTLRYIPDTAQFCLVMVYCIQRHHRRIRKGKYSAAIPVRMAIRPAFPFRSDRQVLHIAAIGSCLAVVFGCRFRVAYAYG